MTIVRARLEPPAHRIPEDLRIFQERMAANGVHVAISVAGPGYQLPAPVHLDGTPLSDVVRQMREAE